MTPPEHLFIGFSIGNIFYSIQTFLNKKYIPYLLLIFLAGVLAIIPDIDSFWGNYTSNNVYIGHRGITHSIFFIFMVSATVVALISIVVVIYCFINNKSHSSDTKIKLFMLFMLLFFSGLSHLLADLPQPPGVWNGIPLFYPYQSNEVFVRTGGWSKIGWYDYKILWPFISIAVVSVFLTIIILVLNQFKLNVLKKIIAIIVFLINIVVNIWMVNYIHNSQYISAHHWERIQNEYIKNSNPIISTVTMKGRNYFLKLFHTIK